VPIFASSMTRPRAAIEIPIGRAIQDGSGATQHWVTIKETALGDLSSGRS
jgi:hypothetical protein